MSQVLATPTAGSLLRDWRQRRRLSQLELSVRANVSARHLSFLETGRSTPSRDMVVHLAEHLDIPLRERNVLLTTAGYAPVYPQHDLAEAEMESVRVAIDRLLVAHEPYPALVVDRWWNLISANAGMFALVEDVAADLLEPPANVMRASLDPRGLAPRIRNLGEWRSHLLTRLRGQVEHTADPQLQQLLDDLTAMGPAVSAAHTYNGVAVPLRITSSLGDLNFLSTIMTFGTAVDVTVADLSIELFFPADEATRERVASSSS